MIRTPFLIIWIVLLTIYLSIAAIIVSFTKEGCILSNKIATIWARCVLFSSRIRVTLTGTSNIDLSRPHIYMSNHQSAFDIFVLQACLPGQFRWLAKAELFKIPVFGCALRRAGQISIDRSNLKSAYKSLENAARNIRNGVSVIIFPEGTRSKDGNISEFKKGGFILAVDASVPIIPVIIHGIWPLMLKNRMLIKPGNILIELKEPIKTTDYTRKTKDDLLEKVRKVICESFEEGRKRRRVC